MHCVHFRQRLPFPHVDLAVTSSCVAHSMRIVLGTGEAGYFSFTSEDAPGRGLEQGVPELNVFNSDSYEY